MNPIDTLIAFFIGIGLVYIIAWIVFLAVVVLVIKLVWNHPGAILLVFLLLFVVTYFIASGGLPSSQSYIPPTKEYVSPGYIAPQTYTAPQPEYTGPCKQGFFYSTGYERCMLLENTIPPQQQTQMPIVPPQPEYTGPWKQDNCPTGYVRTGEGCRSCPKGYHWHGNGICN